MRSHHFLFSLVALLLPLAIFSQTKTFTPEEVVGLNSSLYSKNLSQLQWMGEIEKYTYVEGNVILVSNPKSKNNDTLLTIKQLNESLKASISDSLIRLPQLKWLDAEKGYFFTKNTLILLELPSIKTKKITQLPDDAANITVTPRTLRVAYTVLNNLYVAEGEKHVQITKDSQGIVNGQSVHRNEFGIDNGIFWSPDELKLAFYRMDETMVTSYPLVDISQRIATLKEEKYPMAGMTSHQVTLGVYDINNSKTIFLETGTPAEQYLTSVSWNPESSAVYTAILNRDQNHMKLKCFDAITGQEVRTLFEEKDAKYVEPSHPLFFIPGKPDQFIWISDRDGYDHFYHYSTDGTLIGQITSGEWMITDFLGFDTKGTKVFFQSTKESPLQQNTYALELKSSKITRLTPDKGTHRSQVSKSGAYVIDSYSNAEVSREIQILDSKSNKIKSLLTTDNPLADYKMGRTSIFQLTADDGTVLNSRLILPFDFDPSKKYPVIVYVYGGPHAQLITESWLNGANFYLHYLTQKGYIVFTLDNRGSDRRGKIFEQAIHRQVGKVELNDQMKGIDYLKTLPYVDADRIGVDGWSYGGFMSINMKLSHPEVFKVATAGGPVIDWNYYEIMYGERYMDHPDDNKDGYNASNLLNKVKQLEGKLLVIHGDSDPVVVWQNSLSFIKKCVDEGKLVDYFVYPGHEHNVRGKDRAHLIKKITTYFDENL
ncbi:MAG: dipeptidyl aminopeptidase IV [Bacteroidetes bacterium]|nr:MAG: dipeptidyl aminopeptidase IV [Bacteroidota bacterium]